jgi:hypothetical protein
VRFYALITGAVLTHEVQDEPAVRCVGNPNLHAVGAGHRVWFVYAYHGSDAPADEERVLVQHLQLAGHLIGSIHRPNATAYLFDFVAPPDRTGVVGGDLTCVTVTIADPVRATGLTTGAVGLGRGV